MADAKKPQLEKITTPRGVFVFPKLNQPDVFKGKSTYNTKFRVRNGTPGLEELCDKLQEQSDAQVEKATAELTEQIQALKPTMPKRKALEAKLAQVSLFVPFKAELDADTGEETGYTLFNFKMNSSFKNKKGEEIKVKPYIFDAKGVDITANAPAIWGGTVGKVSAFIFPFYNEAEGSAGVTFRLRGVQIIDLVTAGQGASAAGMGFGEEDGYDGSMAAEKASKPEAEEQAVEDAEEF